MEAGIIVSLDQDAMAVYGGPVPSAAVVRPLPWARIPFGLASVGALLMGLRAASGGEMPGIWVAIDAAVLLASVGVGVFEMSSGLFGRPIIGARSSAAGSRLAITFDDGPDEAHTRELLDDLEARGHRATFFVIGARAQSMGPLLEEICRRGHLVANHSYSHSYRLTLRSLGAVVADLARGQSVCASALGRANRWFRPPVGLLSPPVALAARRLGLELIGWTASARDGTSMTSVDGAAARLARACRPGAILVMHDGATGRGGPPIARAVLARVLDVLDARGLRSVTLDDLLL